MFQLTNPDTIRGPDKLNKLHAELKRLAELLNVFTASVDPVRRYKLDIVNVSVDEIVRDDAPTTVTEVRVGTLLDAPRQYDLFTKNRLARQYVFRENGSAEVSESHKETRMFTNAGEALEDLLLHLRQGMNLLREDIQEKVHSLEETCEALLHKRPAA